jgi:hypothetical protein
VVVPAAITCRSTILDFRAIWNRDGLLELQTQFAMEAVSWAYSRDGLLLFNVGQSWNLSCSWTSGNRSTLPLIKVDVPARRRHLSQFSSSVHLR